MRICPADGKPGDKKEADLYCVTFNGAVVPSHDLLLADSDTGILATIKRGSDGKPVYKDGDTITIIERGKVKIRLIEVVRTLEEVPFA